MNQDDSRDQPGAGRAAAARPRLSDPPVPVPSPQLLVRHNARVLDPLTAARIPGQPAVRPTVYVGDRLLVRGVVPGSPNFAALAEAAARSGCTVEPFAPDRVLTRLLTEDATVDPAARPSRVVLRPAGPAPSSPPDAWTVLQDYRSIIAPGSAAIPQDVALEHLLTAHGGPGIGGMPAFEGHGLWGAPAFEGHGAGAASQYGVPGYGGRQPVDWVGADPYRRDTLPCRRPVVAILDTGVGSHRWLPAGTVIRHPSVHGVPLGLTDPLTDPELEGVLEHPLEGTLDPDAGHGTFIAGIVHQICPDATVLAVRVMGSDGAVAEGDLLNAVCALLSRQRRAIRDGDADSLIDVLSLSLGYYHEQPEDAQFDPMLLAPLLDLGRCGVAVVASAGNDSTSAPVFPAAFAPHPGGLVPTAARDAVALISVGASNPNRDTVALFSNDGPWVVCRRPGAAVVSALPRTFNGSGQPSYRVPVPGGPDRATIDPDDFRGGFGVWSGTSFSAPVLAGEIARFLLDERSAQLGDVNAGVDRGWAAITSLVGMVRP